MMKKSVKIVDMNIKQMELVIAVVEGNKG